MRFFNTEGPVVARKHYCIPPLERIDHAEVLELIRRKRYFVLHAPRQTGKTSALLALRDLLEAGGAGDYRIHSSTERAVVTGGSAFNIRAESLRLGDFTEAEVRVLLAQHTEETGQAFTAGALETVWAQTLGQPWLVNALCARACFGDKAGRDRSRAITAEAVMAAREHLVQSRQVHLDQLADKLQEERVRRVVEPLLSGGGERASTARDFVYEVDAETEPARDRRPMSYTEVHLAHVGVNDFRSNPRGELGTRTATLHRIGRNHHIRPRHQRRRQELGPTREELAQSPQVIGREHREARQRRPGGAVERRRDAPHAAGAVAKLLLLLRRVLDESVRRVRDHRVDGIPLPLLQPLHAVAVNHLRPADDHGAKAAPGGTDSVRGDFVVRQPIVAAARAGE